MKNLFYLFLLLPFFIKADIKSQIKEIEKNKIEKHNYVLQNNKIINLNEWRLILFTRSTCIHCQKFNPIIKEIVDKINLKTVVFAFDNVGDPSFKDVLPAEKSIVSTFFRDLPVATPTTFLINVNTLKAGAVSQGEMNANDFLNSINRTLVVLTEEN